MAFIKIDYKKAEQLLVKAIYHEGYEKDLEKSSQSWLAFRHPTTGDKVVVSQKSGYTKYFNPNDNRDHGNTIDFLQKRMGLSSEKNAANMNALAAHIAKIDSAAVEEKSYGQTASAVKQVKFTYTAEALPEALPPRVEELLKLRGLNADMLRTTDVKNSVSLLKIWRQGLSTPIAANLAFNFRDEQGKIVGKQYKYLSPTGGTAKIFTPGTPRERALWITSPIQDKTAIFICEDPIDALSFRQMHPDRNYALIATGGTISEGQLNFIKQLALKFNKPIVLGNDNDIAGQLANLAIIKAFCPEFMQERIKVISKNNKEQTAALEIKGVEQRFTLNELKDYNRSLTVHAKVSETARIFTTISQTKDWNADLVSLKNIENIEDAANKKYAPSPMLAKIMQQSNHIAEQVAQYQNNYIKL